MTVTLVVAIGENRVIGRDGGLPWPPTGDLKQFKALTMGHPIIMGRSTYESIGKPLPGRTSIVLTRDTEWQAEGVEVAHSLTDGLALALGRDAEVFVIGGAQVFAEAMVQGLVDSMVVTHVQLSPEGDVWFPDVDWTQWSETAREPHDGYDIVTYEHVV